MPDEDDSDTKLVLTPTGGPGNIVTADAKLLTDWGFAGPAPDGVGTDLEDLLLTRSGGGYDNSSGTITIPPGDTNVVYADGSSPCAGTYPWTGDLVLPLANLRNDFNAAGPVFSDTGGTTPAVDLDPVARINDSRPTGKTFVQAVMGFRPVFHTGGVNGLPYLAFRDPGGGAREFLVGGSSFVTPAAYTVAGAVARQGDVGKMFLFGSTLNFSADNLFGLVMNDPAGGYHGLYVFFNGGVDNEEVFKLGAASGLLTWFIARAQQVGGDIDYRIETAAGPTSNFIPGQTLQTSGGSIWQVGDDAFPQSSVLSTGPLEADVYRLLFFDAFLTGSEYDGLKAFLIGTYT